MFKKSIICIALLSSASANSTVCTDPTGLGQVITQTGQDMMIFAKEQGLDLTKIGIDEALAVFQDKADTMRTLTQTQLISGSNSETANLNQQAKMEPSPSMCDSINSVMGIYESLDDFYCESSEAAIDFAGQLAQVVQCTDGRCDTPQQHIADEAVELFENEVVSGGVPDMSKLNIAGLLPGMGEGGYSKSPDEKIRIDTLLKVMFNPGDVPPMPTEANGDMISEQSSPQMKKLYNRWLREFLRTTAGYTTALRVSGLTDPRDENGSKIQSILEQVKKDVDFYNSPDQLKLMGNGGDKTCYSRVEPSLRTQKEKEDWFKTPAGIECKKNFTTVEQVQRMTAEMTARNMSLLNHIYDSNLSKEFNLAVQTQILNEILNKRGR
ncbi:hypothetical protein OCT63_19525 [Vibrio sp. RW]|uniref:hypothetical protein n=1 Tax=Vibrio sp. RW TaxID=2998833 RepID=UPI0022CD52A9|nr:hypothetical protein [Vibrio sp. RW]MDA0146420.1 hypothetical protein [Vibrio sp. RW]